jgi:hypothetical protein
MHGALSPQPGPQPGPQPDDRTPADRRQGPSLPFARLARTLAGALLLVAGAAMLVLPGPGILVIVAGLTLLAVDYAWAKRLLVRARQKLDTAGHSLAHRLSRRRVPPSQGSESGE